MEKEAEKDSLHTPKYKGVGHWTLKIFQRVKIWCSQLESMGKFQE